MFALSSCFHLLCPILSWTLEAFSEGKLQAQGMRCTSLCLLLACCYFHLSWPTAALGAFITKQLLLWVNIKVFVQFSELIPIPEDISSIVPCLICCCLVRTKSGVAKGEMVPFLGSSQENLVSFCCPMINPCLFFLLRVSYGQGIFLLGLLIRIV